ncbi:hypothetical protein ABEB36_000626 [Hypothenemus hampei]|uniref:NADH dehydrogenase [ubiquinone] iron-sulfur protein 4, mitochondrial n=1 Tax=Hypothenemus hampei TaxID=57062 RepID=A0ABD1FFH6_HYPHA
MALNKIFHKIITKFQCETKNFYSKKLSPCWPKDKQPDYECRDEKSLIDAKVQPQINIFETDEDRRKNLLRKCKIILRCPDDFSLISRRPLNVACTQRLARIHQPPKNVQQQGTMHLGHWLIDFDTSQRWENPLMGWCSSGDPLSNLQIRFATKDEAIEYCKKNKMKFWVETNKIKKKFNVRSYKDNFHHNKRIRASTK